MRRNPLTTAVVVVVAVAVCRQHRHTVTSRVVCTRPVTLGHDHFSRLEETGPSCLAQAGPPTTDKLHLEESLMMSDTHFSSASRLEVEKNKCRYGNCQSVVADLISCVKCKSSVIFTIS